MVKSLCAVALSFVALAAAVPGRAQIFSLPPAYNTDTVEIGPPGLLAQSFELMSPSLLTSVEWWGSAGRNVAGNPGADTFSIQLFAGSGGPMATPMGPAIATLAFPSPTIVHTGQTDASQGNGPYPVIQYTANLTSSEPLMPMTQYFLSISDTTAADNWGWQLNELNGSPLDSFAQGPSPWLAIPTQQLAFALNPPPAATPEPGTIDLVAGSALGAIVGLAGRRASRVQR